MKLSVLDELIEKCKIDTDKWEITKYVRTIGEMVKHPHWQVKAWLGKKLKNKFFKMHL